MSAAGLPAARDAGVWVLAASFDVLVTVGAAFTVKQPTHEPEPPSTLVTKTVRAPLAALEATLMFAVMWVESVTVTLLTVMLGSWFGPRKKYTAAGFWNPVPPMVTSLFDAPAPSDDGVTLVTVGAAVTVNAPGMDTPPPAL